MVRLVAFILLIALGVDAVGWIDLSADSLGQYQIAALLLIAIGVSGGGDFGPGKKFGSGNFINVSFGDKKSDAKE